MTCFTDKISPSMIPDDLPSSKETLLEKMMIIVIIMINSYNSRGCDSIVVIMIVDVDTIISHELQGMIISYVSNLFKSKVCWC